ncbi:MAG: sigma factor-like helix-turn-helix DNA-binding protein [Nanoarchaeota archaeon]
MENMIQLRQKAGRDYISVEELTKVTGFSSEIITQALLDLEPFSLDNVQTQEDESSRLSFHSVLEDKTSVSPLEQVFQAQQNDLLYRALESTLSSRELDLIKKRCGFEGEAKTLDQIGAGYGLSRERIRQLEKEVLQKLRKNRYVRELGLTLKE